MMWSKQIADILYEFNAQADITLEDLAELIIEETPFVHGKWLEVEVIDNEEPFGVNDAAQCSVCGYTDRTGFYWPNTYYNYCPHCGAKMDGGKDDGVDC